MCRLRSRLTASNCVEAIASASCSSGPQRYAGAPGIWTVLMPRMCTHVRRITVRTPPNTPTPLGAFAKCFRRSEAVRKKIEKIQNPRHANTPEHPLFGNSRRR